MMNMKNVMNIEYNELGFESRRQYMFPNIVNLCVLRGLCGCNCVHCPVGRLTARERLERFGNAAIGFDLFKKIVDEMSAFDHTTLRIHAVGEPVLWADLPDALRFASERGVRTWLFTALVTEDATLLEAMARYCDILEISLNAKDEKEYERTKGIDAYERVTGNIERLRHISESEGLSPRIVVSRVESEDKEYDAAFVDYWRESGWVDDAFVRTYHDYNTLLENRFSREREEIIPCLVHWSRFNIDCDGSAVLCFNELFKGKRAAEGMILGNLGTESIADIWHGEKLNMVRLAQLNGDYSIVTFTEGLPCEGCSSCQSLYDKSKPTSEHQVASIEGK